MFAYVVDDAGILRAVIGKVFAMIDTTALGLDHARRDDPLLGRALRLGEPNACPPSVLGDEGHAGGFKGHAKQLEI